MSNTNFRIKQILDYESITDLINTAHENDGLVPVLCHPDHRLSTIAQPVTEFNSALKTLTDIMFKTMYQHKGIGLAATQVNYHYQIIVMDLTEDQSQQFILINPKIIHQSQDLNEYNEGCLSVPGIYEKVKRPKTITIQAQDLTGKWFDIQADELLATCIQHEIDHLNGHVFLAHVSKLKRDRATQKLIKAINLADKM